jgi:hypothetical protein
MTTDPQTTDRARIVAAIKSSPFEELRTVDHAPNGPLHITVGVDDLADTLMRALAAAPVAVTADLPACDCEAEVHIGEGFYHQRQCATRTVPVVRPELRDQIAEALREHYLCTNPEEADADGNMPCRCGDWREPGPMGSDEDDWDAHLADAVLSVLPATTNRAAVLHEVDWIVEHCPDHGCVQPETEVCHCEIADRLRRMAVEAQQQTGSGSLELPGPKFKESAESLNGATETPVCPDPIECGHEAALGQAQQEIRRLGLMVDEYGHGASALSEKLQEARATNRRLNLRAQGLESELATYRRAVSQWEVSKRGTYVPLRTIAAIAKAAGRDIETPQWLLHYQRVEQAEAAIERAERLALAFEVSGNEFIGARIRKALTGITDQPAVVAAVAGEARGLACGCPDEDATEHGFGTEDCTCVPFTRQTDPPRYCQPGDTVDMVTGWERGTDCPHHRKAAAGTPEVEAHPPTHTWKVESPRRDNWASWGATHDERVWAAASYDDVIEVAPQRAFRLVRATTTYAVEAEHAPAAVSQPGKEN